MINIPLIAKLRQFAPISEDDAAELERLTADVRLFRARQDLIREGDEPEVVFLLLEGWGFRYKILPDGKRQIMAIWCPGALCDAHIVIVKYMDHSIGLFSDAKVALIAKQAMLDLFDKRPQLAKHCGGRPLPTRPCCANGW